jgi:hypothetical protein
MITTKRTRLSSEVVPQMEKKFPGWYVEYLNE